MLHLVGFFLRELYYDARIHERQVLSTKHKCVSAPSIFNWNKSIASHQHPASDFPLRKHFQGQRHYRESNTILSPTDVSLLYVQTTLNFLNPELNPICYLLALLAHHFLHVSRIRVKSLTLRLLMSYIYIWSTYS